MSWNINYQSDSTPSGGNMVKVGIMGVMLKELWSGIQNAIQKPQWQQPMQWELNSDHLMWLILLPQMPCLQPRLGLLHLKLPMFIWEGRL